jgi:hypothetical protein
MNRELLRVCKPLKSINKICVCTWVTEGGCVWVCVCVCERERESFILFDQSIEYLTSIRVQWDEFNAEKWLHLVTRIAVRLTVYSEATIQKLEVSGNHYPLGWMGRERETYCSSSWNKVIKTPPKSQKIAEMYPIFSFHPVLQSPNISSSLVQMKVTWDRTLRNLGCRVSPWVQRKEGEDGENLRAKSLFHLWSPWLPQNHRSIVVQWCYSSDLGSLPMC